MYPHIATKSCLIYIAFKHNIDTFFKKTQVLLKLILLCSQVIKGLPASGVHIVIFLFIVRISLKQIKVVE